MICQIFKSILGNISAFDDVSQSGFGNLSKLLFFIRTVFSIMQLQVILSVLSSFFSKLFRRPVCIMRWDKSSFLSGSSSTSNTPIMKGRLPVDLETYKERQVACWLGDVRFAIYVPISGPNSSWLELELMPFGCCT